MPGIFLLTASLIICIIFLSKDLLKFIWGIFLWGFLTAVAGTILSIVTILLFYYGVLGILTTIINM
jgi:hypothetical protein